MGLLLVLGPISFYYLLRWTLRHKLPSIAIALLPSGWVTVALLSLGVLPLEGTLPQLVGLGMAVFALVAIVQQELAPEEDVKPTLKRGAP